MFAQQQENQKENHKWHTPQPSSSDDTQYRKNQIPPILTEEDIKAEAMFSVETSLEPFGLYLEMVEKLLEKEKEKYRRVSRDLIEQMRAEGNQKEFTDLYPPGEEGPIVSIEHAYLQSVSLIAKLYGSEIC